jgi:alkanesulfonate monooxygenase SsuD/methylene tetrahydromethanopterin reductase-like flavin-dependent oxidoreductase (luciferase family)
MTESTVQFGWRVPAFPSDGSDAASFREQVFRAVDALPQKFASLWVADHFIPWDSKRDPRTPTLESWTTITYLAARYPAFTLGSIVLSQSYRNPALLAKMAAVLQWLSGGRFVLGIGAGWKEEEYRAYGYAFPSAATRIHQLEEAVQIIRRMWTEPRATFRGETYHIEEAFCEPRPDPPPPLLIGGGGRKLTLRVVARHADWWNIPDGTAEYYQASLDVLREHCEAVGRDYERIVKTWACECVAVAPGRKAAEQMAQASPYYRPGESVVGTPDEVRAHLQRYVDMGVRHFILRFADFPKTEGADLFARAVIPAFQ